MSQAGLVALCPTLHSLRHGGARHDFAQGSRTLLGIMHRGAWRSVLSVKRYEKSGLLARELNKLSRAHVLRLEQARLTLERDYMQLFAPHFVKVAPAAPKFRLKSSRALVASAQHSVA